MSLATAEDFKAVERLIAGLPDKARRELEANPLVAAELKKPWRPEPGPQTEAYYSLADILLFGGEPGGAKTDLLIGLSLTAHTDSAIFRSQSKDLRGIEKRFIELTGEDNYNRSEAICRYEGRTVELGHLAAPGAEEGWQGRPHDFLGFDEGAQIARQKISFVMTWLRAPKGRRCRVVIATNPPLSAEGEYLIEWFAPWLDPTYPDPAVSGELRWAITDSDGKRRWVDGPGEYPLGDGKTANALSYTFIRSKLSDNPHYGPEYRRQLENIEDPVMRRALLDGDFMAYRIDHDDQVIPTEWIKLAQARWKPDGWKGNKMTAIGVDVAQGGADRTVLSPRYGAWFAPLIMRPGTQTPDGPSVAGLVIQNRRDQAVIVIDAGGGYGGGAVSYLKDNGVPVALFNGANASKKKTRDGHIPFINKRAEAYFRFRDALDPSQEGGSPLALPPDQELLGDLSSVRSKPLTPRGLQIEAKEDIIKRLGRSPDKGDAAVMGWSEGQALAEKNWRGNSLGNRLPEVHLGFANAKKGR